MDEGNRQREDNPADGLTPDPETNPAHCKHTANSESPLEPLSFVCVLVRFPGTRHLRTPAAEMINHLLEAPARTTAPLAGKHLTFLIGEELYAIPVLKVREIIRHTPITPVPRMPSYVRGVLNLRGKVIPVVDLRIRFGLGDGTILERTCIIVVQKTHPDGQLANMGLIVDSVRAVAQIAESEIEPTPNFGGQLSAKCILAMAKLEDRVVTLLDIDQALDACIVNEPHHR